MYVRPSNDRWMVFVAFLNLEFADTQRKRKKKERKKHVAWLCRVSKKGKA
ncbi:hypothetical protein M427DRAFT_58096 [Gonapodya prolifera JEL478]|uniref:Uncharacterized protein n=1 Tax=Gonapodya prolifera (strain JEL478) TaxID=1344416 RepID=A0A139AAK6_GONPJ|nr:hypothetical protein M427DRAFT_58096 [Gonapodya prolifera JEL478]|eukprot:KXS13841.1 hypothetical protein M427DRAFT_58096 [Gonapodya prolifera JEL478]